MENPETAKEYGELFLPKLDNKPYLTTVSRSQKVTNLCALKPSIKIGSKSIRQDQCGQMALFNRLILIAARDSCVEKCLDFELTCYPLGIFNIYGFMRASNKSAFGALFKDRLEGTAEQPRPSVMVIDGGCILWEVEWKIGATYAQFGDNVVRKIKSMSAAMIVLIFDGYAPLAKDLEHASRLKCSCARQLFGKDKKNLVNRNRFFSNGSNKECLIAFLRIWLNMSDILQGSAVTLIIKKSDKDADMLTVKSAKEESEKTNQPVVVHGTDTDILMLLVFHSHMNTNLF